MSPAEFIARLRAAAVRYPGEIRMHDGLTDEELDEFWDERPELEDELSGQRLPASLLSLLRMANGIELWGNYFSILPLVDWQPVRFSMFGRDIDAEDESYRAVLPDTVLTMTDHADGSHYVAVDLAVEKYLDADVGYGGEPEPIGATIESLLDWIWQHWIEGMRPDAVSPKV